MIRLGVITGLLALCLPWQVYSRTDSLEAQTLQKQLERMLELGKAADQFYRDSIAPRSLGAGVMPASPAWKISAGRDSAAGPALRAAIPGIVGCLILHLPESVSFLIPPETRLQVDSCKATEWESLGANAYAFHKRIEPALELDCRVDGVGPLINYRLTVKNTGANTLSGLIFSVSVGTAGWPYLSGSDPAGASAPAKGRIESFLGRLYFRTSAGLLRALDLEDGRDGRERSVFPAEEVFADTPDGGLPGSFIARTGFRPERISGNTTFLNSVDRRWRIEVSASPPLCFFYDPRTFSFGADPGLVRLAPGESASLGGIIALNPAD